PVYVPVQDEQPQQNQYVHLSDKSLRIAPDAVPDSLLHGTQPHSVYRSGRERIQDRLSNHRNQRSLLPGSSALRNGYRKSHRLTSDPDECPTVPEYLVRNADRFRKCAHGSADGSGCTPRLPAGRSTEKDALLTFQQRSGLAAVRLQRLDGSSAALSDQRSCR